MQGIDAVQKILHLCVRMRPEDIQLASYLADVWQNDGILTIDVIADSYAWPDRDAYFQASRLAHALKMTKHEGRPPKIYPVLTEQGRRYLMTFFPEE